MGDLARDDEIERPLLVEIVAGTKFDWEPRRRRDLGGMHALLVEIDTNQIGLNAAPSSPKGDGPQDVAVAKADVEQPKCLRGSDPALHEGKHRVRGKGPAIHPG